MDGGYLILKLIFPNPKLDEINFTLLIFFFVLCLWAYGTVAYTHNLFCMGYCRLGPVWWINHKRAFGEQRMNCARSDCV